jgi:hypothetical protein
MRNFRRSEVPPSLLQELFQTLRTAQRRSFDRERRCSTAQSGGTPSERFRVSLLQATRQTSEKFAVSYPQRPSGSPTSIPDEANGTTEGHCLHLCAAKRSIAPRLPCPVGLGRRGSRLRDSVVTLSRLHPDTLQALSVPRWAVLRVSGSFSQSHFLRPLERFRSKAYSVRIDTRGSFHPLAPRLLTQLFQISRGMPLPRGNQQKKE